MRSPRDLPTVRFAALLVGLTIVGEARATTIDFEGFPDSTIVTTQYPGLTFSNTIILTSGISLNEFEFPPHSRWMTFRIFRRCLSPVRFLC
jgi:hypothetical protein